MVVSPCLMLAAKALKGMTKGVDLGWPLDQETFSFGSEGVPSYVDTSRVITWLDSMLSGGSTHSLLMFEFFFPPLGPRFMANTEEDRGGMNFMY